MGKLYPGPLRGTWTPALTFVTPGDLSVAYSVQLGEWYLRDGLATLFFVITTSTWTWTTASGNSRITGSPFTAKTLAGMTWAGNLDQVQGVTKASYTHFAVGITSGQTIIVPHANGSAQNVSGITAADLPTGTVKVLMGSVTYPIA